MNSPLDSQAQSKGRGSQLNLPNRFLPIEVVPDPEYFDWEERESGGPPPLKTQYLIDQSKSIVSENESPDIPFRYSLNPYRGCEHGCSYCYARNSHEYLGFNAGIDFESKIIVKPDAAKLFREFLSNERWKPEEVVFSGVTDCYQPAERSFRLTRACLEVARECRLPIGIITKNALVVRDIDILSEMASQRQVHVNVSITTLDSELARRMEPRTSTPSGRLRAIEQLSNAGIPTRVMAAPMIPGLNDSELPAILEAARNAGARSATYILLRLPVSVEPVFLDWLRNTFPLKSEKVERMLRDMRNGKLNSSGWGTRMRGVGETSQQLNRLFRVFAKKFDLDRPLPAHDFTNFRLPLKSANGQLRLF